MMRGRHGGHNDNNRSATIHIKIRGRLLAIILKVWCVSVILLALHAWILVSRLLVCACEILAKLGSRHVVCMHSGVS
jgi:hypothetical protein